MPEVKKVTAMDKSHSERIVADKAKSHANDPFVLKKVARAKEIVSKIKFPDYSIK